MALAALKNCLYLNVKQGLCHLILLLYLDASFDTADHAVLLGYLQNMFWIDLNFS